MVERAVNDKPIESVWDFPRPPRLERVPWRIRVIVDGSPVVDAPEALRVLETSQAPAYYVSSESIDFERLSARPDHRTFCEWKGVASYADVIGTAESGSPLLAERAAWTYPDPTPAFRDLIDHWAFYAQAIPILSEGDGCWVDDERVDGNDGDFYGGWITSNVTGPFKGAPGTRHW